MPGRSSPGRRRKPSAGLDVGQAKRADTDKEKPFWKEALMVRKQSESGFGQQGQ